MALNLSRPCAVDRSGRYRIARFFVHRQGFAAEHGFVHGRGPIEYDTVHRDTFAGPHDHGRIPLHGGQRHLFFDPVFQDERSLGLQADQFTDRTAGFAFRSGFEQLADFNQGDNHRSRLEVDMAPQSGDQQHGQGVKVSDRGPHGDQHIHIGTAVAQAFERAHIVIPAGVKLDRGGQCAEHPVDPERMAPQSQHAEITEHAEHEQWQREKHAHAELARLVADFGAARGLLGIFGARVCLGGDGAVAGLFNGGHNFLDRQRAGQVIDTRSLGRKIHGRIDHAFNFFIEGPLDIGRTIGAGHAGNRHFHAGGRHAVAAFAHLFDQVFDLDLTRIEGNIGTLGGEIDMCVVNAVQLGKAALYIGGAVDAAHAT